MIHIAFLGSHIGQEIADAFEAINSEAAIGNNIRSLVNDNASNMKWAITLLFDETATSSDVDDPTLWNDTDEADLPSQVTSGGVSTDCHHISCFAHSL